MILLLKGSSEKEFLDNYITTFFGVRNFGNTWGMSVIVFWKCSKFNLDSENAKNNSRKKFFSAYIIISIGSIKLSLLIRQNLSSTFNVLIRSLNILHTTFYTIIWQHISKSVILEIHQLWESFFFKMLKIYVDFKNQEKNSEIVFHFWGNCI